MLNGGLQLQVRAVARGIVLQPDGMVGRQEPGAEMGYGAWRLTGFLKARELYVVNTDTEDGGADSDTDGNDSRPDYLILPR